MKRYLRYWILAAPLLATAQVAEVEVGAPTLGYVLDETARQLFPIQGVPGAAVLGGAMNLNAPIDRVWLSPNRRHGFSSSGAGLTLLKLDGAAGVARVLPGESPLAVGFSPDGGSAAVLRGASIELWRGLPDHPALARSFPAPADAVSKLAVSDDGTQIAVLSEGRLLLAGSESHVLSRENGFTDLCFAASSQTLLALDAQANRVLSWNKVSESNFHEIVATEAEGIDRPLAMSLSSDDAVLAILGARHLVLLDRATGRTAAVDVSELKAEGLWRASGNAVFQLHRRAAARSWMLDADSAEPRLFSAAGREKE